MADIWKTDLITTDERCTSYMACVILPINEIKLGKQILDELLINHNTYISIGQFDGKVYCRICGQIYNEAEDYRKIAEIILTIIKKKLIQN